MAKQSGKSDEKSKGIIELGKDYPLSPEFIAWSEQASIKTLPEIIRRSVDEFGERNCIGRRVGTEFIFKTYNEIYEEVIYFAAALLEIGCSVGDRVANFSSNCMEWPVVDFGSAHAGCIHVPMYATLSLNELEHILKDSQAAVVFVRNEEQLKKVVDVAPRLKDLKYIITCASLQNVNSEKQLWSWNDFIQYGKVHLVRQQLRIEEIVSSLDTSDVASIIYTSGTTGDSKGVMLMHGNFCSQLEALQPMVQVNENDVHLSFLPFSHVFERIFYYLGIYSGASIGLAQSLITVLQDMQVLHPTTFTSVPALYIKLYERAMSHMTGFKKAPFHWAMQVGRSYNAKKRMGRVAKTTRLLQSIARKTLFSDILKKTGGRLRIRISGGAPLPADVCEFFLNIGFMVREGYGLTETSPVLTLTPQDNIRPGSAGCIIHSVEGKIAEDGEFLVKGPNIMRGYYKRPKDTEEAIDSEGWFHTGDVGYLDDNALFITDRKKNLLVLANGKNIAPSKIEFAICKSAWISGAVLVGNNRSRVGAVIVPDFEALAQWAEKRRLSFADNAELIAYPEVQELIRSEINTACEPFSAYEKVKCFYISDREFSVSLGELTATHKLKRRVVERNFSSEIDKMFGADS
ncbi:long-chain fatty acid--CoA ligase [bacterium]|nr:long-chain fatty acid--CoA ligase [bacterium]